MCQNLISGPYIPKIKGTNKVFPIAKQGNKVWKDSPCKLNSLPEFRGKMYHFLANKTEIMDDLVIETKGPATIYYLIGTPKENNAGGGGEDGGEDDESGKDPQGQPNGKGVSGIVRRKRDNWIIQDDYQSTDLFDDEDYVNEEIENEKKWDWKTWRMRKDLETIYGPANGKVVKRKEGKSSNDAGTKGNVNFESPVYLSYENGKKRHKRSDEFYKNLEDKGWKKVEYDKLATSCFEKNDVWKKTVTTKGTISVTVPKLAVENREGVVFVSGR